MTTINFKKNKNFLNEHIEVIGSDTETLKEIKEKIIQKIMEKPNEKDNCKVQMEGIKYETK